MRILILISVISILLILGCLPYNAVYAEGVDGENGTALNSSDFVPYWINPNQEDIWLEGDYAYICSGGNGLHIFDIADPLNPVLVNTVCGDAGNKICVSSGYAYTFGYSAWLNVYDITSPETAYLAYRENTHSNMVDLSMVVDGILYTRSVYGFSIYDISPDTGIKELSHHTCNVFISCLAVSGGYAYLGINYVGLAIIDVDPPAEEHNVGGVKMDLPSSIAISDGFAYVTVNNQGLTIVDIDPPESAHIISTVTDPVSADHNSSLAIDGGLACIADYKSGLHIYDVGNPEDAGLLKIVECPGPAMGVKLRGCIAYVISGDEIYIIDLRIPEDAYVVKSFFTPW